MNREMPKYEYLLHTWGGFYNKDSKDIHKKEEGFYWFDTKEKRQEYIDELERLSKELNAHVLMISLNEGYHMRIETICHRVVQKGNERIYSSLNLGYAYPITAAQYHMEWKWTPGFNDEAAIKDERDINTITIVAEWITGAHNLIKKE